MFLTMFKLWFLHRAVHSDQKSSKTKMDASTAPCDAKAPKVEDKK